MEGKSPQSRLQNVGELRTSFNNFPAPALVELAYRAGFLLRIMWWTRQKPIVVHPNYDEASSFVSNLYELVITCFTPHPVIKPRPRFAMSCLLQGENVRCVKPRLWPDNKYVRAVDLFRPKALTGRQYGTVDL